MFTNPYLYIFGLPALAFVALVVADIAPDPISLVVRIVCFGLYGYVGAKYVGRAPSLVWHRDTSPEAFNVVGWAATVVGSMLQMLYGWLFIIYGRPDWLSSQYWNPAFVTLIAVGLGMVAWSIPRVGIFPGGQRGMSTVAAFFVGFLSAGGMFLIGHIPQVFAFFRGLVGGVSHAL